MIELYLGVMGSGKTTKLCQWISASLDKKKKVFVYDFLNTRNGRQDLKNLIEENQNLEFPDLICYQDEKIFITPNCFSIMRDIELFIFDEVHFYQLHDKSSEFLSFLLHLILNRKNVAMAGIYYDAYANYKPFPIWEQIMPLCDSIKFLTARCDCTDCHNTNRKEVIYTTPTIEMKERVGNHYKNICLHCVRNYKKI